MFLSKKHLVLHTVTGDAQNMPALKGILIDPKNRTATASDGKRLVELSLPKVDKFPVKDLALAGEGDQPFLLSAEDARAIIQSLPEGGKNPTDPARYAAVTCAKGGKISLVTSQEGKAMSHPIVPIDAKFPDYRSGDIFPKENPIGSIVMDNALLRSTLGAISFSEPQAVTIHLFKDKLVFQASGKDGTRARVVQMPLVEPPPEKYGSEPEASGVSPKKESASSAAPSGKTTVSSSDRGGATSSAKPAASQSAQPEYDGSEEETSRNETNTGGRRFSGKRRFFGKKRTFDASTVKPDVPATTGQKAFLTYLLRSRGESLSAADFGAVSMKSAFERIETLKSAKNADESFATFPQWKKLFFLLVEDLKVGADQACATLKGLRSIDGTSKVIDEHQKKLSGRKAPANT